MTDQEFCEGIKGSKRLMFQVANRIVGCAQAEDVVASAVLHAWRGRNTLEESAMLSTWLAAITKNEALDFVRRAKARPQRTNDAEREMTHLDGLSDQRLDPEQLAMRRETIEITARAIEGLPPVMRIDLGRWLAGESRLSVTAKVRVLRAKDRVIPVVRMRLALRRKTTAA